MDKLLDSLRGFYNEFIISQIGLAFYGLVTTVFLTIVCLRVFILLERRYEKEGKSTQSMMASLLRIPATLICFAVVVLTFGELLDINRDYPRFETAMLFIFWLALSWAVIRVLEYLFVVRIAYEQHGLRIPRLFHDLVLWFIYSIVLFTLLNNYYDLDLTTVLGTLGIVSLVLALALQDTLANVFAGLSLHFEGTLELGQWIGVGEHEGEIAGITWRSIKMRTFDGDYVIIPNGMISKSELTNYSQPTRRHILRLPIGVSYECPPGKLKRVCLEVIRQVEGIRSHPTPGVQLQQYNDFSIDYRIRFWIDDYSQYRRIRDEVYTLLWYYFKREDIVIPFPIRTLDIPGRTKPSLRCLLEYEDLRRIDFLDVLEDEQLATIQENMKVKIYATGETIIRQGQDNTIFHVVQSGRLEISISDSKSGNIVLNSIGQGGYFGEHSLFTGEKTSATIVALEDTVLATLDQSIFMDILKSNTEVADMIVKTIVERATVGKKAVKEAAEVIPTAPDATTSEADVQRETTRLLYKLRKLFKL